jgi:hypothetical protein
VKFNMGTSVECEGNLYMCHGRTPSYNIMMFLFGVAARALV